jgi:hypothetical protein
MERPASGAKWVLRGVLDISFCIEGRAVAQSKRTNLFRSRFHFRTGCRTFSLEITALFRSVGPGSHPSITTGAGLAHTFDGDGVCVHQVPGGNRDSPSLFEGRLGATSVSNSAAAARAQAELRSPTDFDSDVWSNPKVPRRLFTGSTSTQLYNRKSVEAYLVRIPALSLHLRPVQMGVPRQRFSGLYRCPGSRG